jgi:hypothetical protein
MAVTNSSRSIVATVQSAPRRARTRTAPPSRALPDTPALLGIAILVLIIGAFAAVRWTGVIPFGSDNDEYPLVARALLETGTPVIGGVEATKYPLAYPLLLALLELLRLPALSGIVVNFLLVPATAFVVARTLARLHTSGFGTFAAAVFVAVNVALWGATTSFMPDVLITLLSAVVLYAVTRMDTVRGAAVVSALIFVTTSVKSVGVLLGGAASLALLLGPRKLRRWFLLPGAAGLLALIVHALIVRPYPEATTGYGRVFFLNNPYDAADGRASLGDIAARLWTRWDAVLGDWGKAVLGPHVGRGIAMTLTVVLLAAGIWALGRRWAYGAGLVAIYGVGLAIWPFASVRFGLPMVPLAALGVGRLATVAVASTSRPARLAGVVAVCALLAVHGVVGFGQAAASAASETITYTELHDHTAEAAHWAEHNIPEGDVIASPAYRELTQRMGGRTILPVSYTTDPVTLWDETGGKGAQWFINLTRLYPRRARVGDKLVNTYRDRFEQVYANDDVVIYRIVED